MPTTTTKRMPTRRIRPEQISHLPLHPPRSALAPPLLHQDGFFTMLLAAGMMVTEKVVVVMAMQTRLLPMRSMMGATPRQMINQTTGSG